MWVGVGYSDNPDTPSAGKEAAEEALKQAAARAEKDGPCSAVLLFSTASHKPETLSDSVRGILGKDVPIIGGGAAGAISNDRFGYAGDQVILAALWLEDVKLDFAVQKDATRDEFEAGVKLGCMLKEQGSNPETPFLLFYDAVNDEGGDIRLVQATPMLAGLEEGLGFVPVIMGAGLMGDFVPVPGKQWAAAETVKHSLLGLGFTGGGMRIDHVIMHGCRPATGYYTVTKSEGQTILEIDGKPALSFIADVLGGAIAPDSFPFFLILGINKGEKWGEFDEKTYISHLCLAIDKERDGIVMFESDMVPGTEFQIMYRSLDPDYIPPKIEGLFENLGDRTPVFALYINCAGRAAGYGGVDMEDALVVQKILNNRAPLVGIYTGVEIASVEGRPRGLDWTGVFCLFSVPKR